MIFLLYILSQVFSVVPFPSHHQVSPSSSHFPDAVIYLLQVPIIMFLFTYYSLRNLLILLPLHLSSWEFISPCASYYVHLSKCTFSFIKIIDHYFFLVSSDPKLILLCLALHEHSQLKREMIYQNDFLWKSNHIKVN